MKSTEWISSLKVGDIVCDCRGKHLKIETIEEEYCNRIPQFLQKIAYHKYAPNFVEEVLWTICSKIVSPKLYDKILLLEDGAYCSAKNCCVDPETCEHGTPDKKEEVQ